MTGCEPFLIWIRLVARGINLAGYQTKAMKTGTELRTILTASMAEELIDDHLESLEINRLREMSVEPRLFVPRDVLVHPEAGQSDGRDCQVLTDMANKIDASSVRQSDVAEKQRPITSAVSSWSSTRRILILPTFFGVFLLD